MNKDEIRDMETAMREFDAFERMYKNEPVTGGTDLERKYQYWIDLGASRAVKNVIKMLHKHEEHFQIGGGYEQAYYMLLGLIRNDEWALDIIKSETESAINEQVDVEQVWSDTLGSGWEYSEWFLGIRYDGGDWDKSCNAKLRHLSKTDEEVIVTTEFTPEMLVEAYNRLVREKYTHCGGCSMDDPDACTSDAVLQYMVYGDLIYG